MARPARHFGHAARLEVDRLETAAPDAPPGRSAGVESKTSGWHQSAAAASPWHPRGGGSPLGPSAWPRASGCASGAVGGRKGRCAQRQQRYCGPAAAEALWPCAAAPTPTPKALHVCPVLRPPTLKARMPHAASRREEVDQCHLVLREELLEVVAAQLLAQIAVGLARARAGGRGRARGSRRWLSLVPTLAGPRGRTAASHQALSGSAAHPRVPSAARSLESPPREARAASCGATRTAL